MQKSVAPTQDPIRISFIIEWANTAHNGVPRFWGLIDRLGRQWQEMVAGVHPDNLEPDAIEFVERFDARPEVFIVSGEKIPPDLAHDIHFRAVDLFDLSIHVQEGLEYHALKNFGAGLASGDIFCFLDSDVHPDNGWLVHLLGSFSRSDVDAVMGQPYVKPFDAFSRAFALGWIYELADDSGRMFPTPKIYANNIAFRCDVFRQTHFTDLKRRTRGASSILQADLARRGITVWENRRARVDHPPPSGFSHMMVRALANGRDYYMKSSEDRSLRGLVSCQNKAAQRLVGGFSRTMTDWQTVGARRFEVPAIFAIIACYYLFLSIGGFLTHLNPEAMGRRWRL